MENYHVLEPKWVVGIGSSQRVSVLPLFYKRLFQAFRETDNISCQNRATLLLFLKSLNLQSYLSPWLPFPFIWILKCKSSWNSSCQGLTVWIQVLFIDLFVWLKHSRENFCSGIFADLWLQKLFRPREVSCLFSTCESWEMWVGWGLRYVGRT